jgi:recombination protein RecR
MDPIRKLTEIFSEFPGIGPRQARRFVYFLLTRPSSYLKDFTSLLSELKDATSTCQSCFRFFLKDGNAFCTICRDEKRDKSLLTVVSKDVDLENIEKAHIYRGLYFVLGGSVPILEKKPESKIRQKELLKTIEARAKENDLKEIILAMNLNPEGENTVTYLENLLKPLIEKYSLKISTLGRGLSTGTELEYSDTETIKNALKNRA